MVDYKFFKSIVEHTSVGYSYNKIVFDEQGLAKDYEFLKVNPKYESIVGIEAKDIIGMRMSQVYEMIKKGSRDWPSFHDEVLKKQNGNVFEYYFEFENFRYRVNAHSPEEGYLIFSLTDVSKEKIETEKLRMLSDNVPIQVWYLSNIDTYLSSNKAHADFMGLDKNFLVNKSIHEFMSESEAQHCIVGNREVFKEKKKLVVEEWTYNVHNQKRLLKITKTPKLNSKGDIEFVICSAEDITEEHFNKEQNLIKERILYSTIDFTRELLTNDSPYNALSNGLEMLGEATQADRVYYWENHFDESSQKWVTNQKLEWCLGSVTQQLDNPDLQDIAFNEVGDFIEVLSQNKTFNVHTKDLDSRSSTKEILESQGVLSILVIPVFVGKEFRGFIGFDSCKKEKNWSLVEISLLKSFVLLYVKTLEKKLLEESIKKADENFNNFFNMIQALVFVLDFDGNIIEVNNNVLERFNYFKEELIGKPISMLHPREQGKELENIVEDLKAKKIDRFNISAITKHGQIIPVETKVSSGLWSGERVVFAVSRDVSDLTKSEEKFSKAFNNSGVSMFISRYDDGEILEVNDTFLKFIGYPKDEVVGKKTLDFNMVESLTDREIIKSRIDTNEKLTDLQIEIVTKENVIRTGLAHIVSLNINNQRSLLTSIVDITDRVEYEKKLIDLNNRDSLTGVFNRLYVYQRAEEIIEEYKRNDKIFSVAIIDIDNFKSINDTYGHQSGDYVLKEFIDTIDDNLRIYDVLGRYGGEEFIILLNQSTSTKGKIVLKRILEIMREKKFIYAGNHIKVTFSAGISSCDELDKDKITIDKLVEIADKRMYQAKENGKNRIVYK